MSLGPSNAHIARILRGPNVRERTPLQDPASRCILPGGRHVLGRLSAPVLRPPNRSRCSSQASHSAGVQRSLYAAFRSSTSIAQGTSTYHDLLEGRPNPHRGNHKGCHTHHNGDSMRRAELASRTVPHIRFLASIPGQGWASTQLDFLQGRGCSKVVRAMLTSRGVLSAV